MKTSIILQYLIIFYILIYLLIIKTRLFCHKKKNSYKPNKKTNSPNLKIFK